MIVKESSVDLETPSGIMRTYVFEPATEATIKPYQEKQYPGLMLFTDIFQMTEPNRRFAYVIASHGYIVLVPEVYHSKLAIGRVLDANNTEEKQIGNDLKKEISLKSWDEDIQVLVKKFKSMPNCSGRVGALGNCLGGHIALRAAFNPDILSAACFYATDVHSKTLGSEQQKGDTLSRLGEIKGEILVLFGRQDPHVPMEGRRMIKKALEDSGVNYQYLEVNGQHAFMRDSQVRFDTKLTELCLDFAYDLWNRTL